MKSPKDYIVFPLDVPSLEAAGHYIRLLSDCVGMFKVGLELFIQAGPEVVRMIHGQGGARVFLDLKLHDIPETVSRAVARIAALDVSFTTVHCGESIRMLEAAALTAGGRVGLLGVTLLTSVSAEDIRSAGFAMGVADDVTPLVLKRAGMAKTAGFAGVVCSGREAGLIKERFGKDFIALTPGIRPSWEATAIDDQQRIATPAQAIRSGSDYLVIGRPIRDAADPKAAAGRIADEIEAALPV